MSFFKVSREQEDLKDSGADGYILKSGFYPVTLRNAFVRTNDKGARTVGFFLEHEGQEQVLFDAIRLENNDGSENFQASLLHKLGNILDIEEFDEPEEASLPIGKGGKEEDELILPDIDNDEVIIRVQMHYSKYDGKIQERKVLKNIFRADDRATASEIINGVPENEEDKQYNKEQKYADAVTYDGVTPKEVEEYLKNRTSGGSSSSAEDKKKSTAKAGGKRGGRRKFSK